MKKQILIAMLILFSIATKAQRTDSIFLKSTSTSGYSITSSGTVTLTSTLNYDTVRVIILVTNLESEVLSMIVLRGYVVKSRRNLYYPGFFTSDILLDHNKKPLPYDYLVWNYREIDKVTSLTETD